MKDLTPRSTPHGTRPSEATSRLLHPSLNDVGQLPLGVDALEAIAGGLARTVDPLQHALAPGTVSRRRIVATATYDVWIVDLAARTRLADHDHDGALGVIAVAAGSVVELAVDGAGARRSRVRHLRPGDHTVVGPIDRHALVNPTSEPTTMVQAFSPPLGTEHHDVVGIAWSGTTAFDR